MQRGTGDGTASVRDGALVVRAPAPGGRPALLRAEEGVELLVGGEPAAAPVEVADPAAVEVRLPEQPPRVAVEVVVAPDRLSATMRVERVPGARFRLEDQPANRDIVLRRRVQERIPCPAPTPDELRALLERHGVVHGVLPDALARLARGSSSAEVVARGDAPRAAAGGRIVRHALPADGALPPYVRAGALLAEIVPADPGAPGRDVHGDPIAPGLASSAALRAGDGARLAEDGRIVAVVAGHASVQDGSVVVRDPLVVEGDAAGTVATPASLHVTGAVDDHARVRARGDVLVEGGVRRATVEAGGSLVLRSPAVEAILRAGHLQHAASEAAPALRAVAEELQRLHAAVVQLLGAAHGAGRALPPVRAVQLATERIAPGLDERVRAAFAAIERERGTVHGEAATRLRHAAASLTDIRCGRRAPAALASLARAFAEESAALAGPDGPAVLAVPAAERSRIEARGVLRLTGRGATDCELVVTGTLDAAGEGTQIRGGEVVVDGAARIAEAGGRGTPLRIRLAPGATLVIGIAHAGVRIEVDGAEHAVSALTHGLELQARAA